MSDQQPQPSSGDNTPASGSTAGPALRGSTLWVSNITKLTGVGLAIHEVLAGAGRDHVLAFCVLLVIGADVVEKVAIHFIDRLFSRD